MTPSVETLAAEVLELPTQDRVRILELLLGSLDATPTPQQAWTGLAKKRRDDVQSGTVAMVPGPLASQRVRASLG